MSKRDSLFMEHTEISPERSAAQICQELVTGGATQISTEYKDGKIQGLRWVMKAAGRDLLFAMPARVDPVYQILLKRAKQGSRWYGSGTAEQQAALRLKAERVAWRQLLRWVEAQLAMIQTGMVESAEVFFPYMVHHQTGETVWRLFRENELKALPAPEEKAS